MENLRRKFISFCSERWSLEDPTGLWNTTKYRLDYQILDDDDDDGLIQKSHLIKISAFYKNDTPNGIGVLFPDVNTELENNLTDSMKRYEDAWESANDDLRKEYVQGYFNQLEHFSQFRSQGRSIQENLMCVINIWFLEKYGFLQTDNYNGCQFIYGSDT